jgi:hypothetical protein
MKLRAVYWFIFPIIMALSIYLNWAEISFQQIGENLLVLSILLSGLFLYLSLKFKKAINPMNGYFAWGDVFFLIAVSPLFNLYSYLFFFTTGTCFVLLLHLTLRLLKLGKKEIPFAGYMAFYLVGILLFFDFYEIPLI